jgi:hypothetical protein
MHWSTVHSIAKWRSSTKRQNVTRHNWSQMKTLFLGDDTLPVVDNYFLRLAHGVLTEKRHAWIVSRVEINFELRKLWYST